MIGGPVRTAGCAIALLLLVALAEAPRAQNARNTIPFPPQEKPPAGELGVLPVRQNVYLLVGEGGNVTAQVGSNGVLLVDTMRDPAATRLLAAVRQLSDKPIRWVISTGVDPDHVSGNEAIVKAGSSIGGTNTPEGRGALVIAHENVLKRMSAPAGETPPYPAGGWPTDTFFDAKLDLFFNDSPIEVVHQPEAITDGNSIVLFRRADVIATGDIFNTDRYPRFSNGGTLQGTIAALNRILAITVPRENQEGGTLVVPGHGHLGDEADVAEYRDMLTIVRDRVQDMVRRRLTLEQVRMQRPTLDYDAIYSHADSPADAFLAAVYTELARAAAPARGVPPRGASE